MPLLKRFDCGFKKYWKRKKTLFQLTCVAPKRFRQRFLGGVYMTTGRPSRRREFTPVRIPSHGSILFTCTVKWKELNRPQKPDRPQFLEGRFGPCWAVLDNKSQNSFRWYRFGPSYFWNGHTKYHFGPSPQFGLSKVQIRRCRFGPKRGHYTLLLIEIKNKFLWFFFLIHNRLRKKRRHVGSKINFLFVGRWYSFVQIIHIHISPKYGPFSGARNWDNLK